MGKQVGKEGGVKVYFLASVVGSQSGELGGQMVELSTR